MKILRYSSGLEKVSVLITKSITEEKRDLAMACQHEFISTLKVIARESSMPEQIDDRDIMDYVSLLYSKEIMNMMDGTESLS